MNRNDQKDLEKHTIRHLITDRIKDYFDEAYSKQMTTEVLHDIIYGSSRSCRRSMLSTLQ